MSTKHSNSQTTREQEYFGWSGFSATIAREAEGGVRLAIPEHQKAQGPRGARAIFFATRARPLQSSGARADIH